MKKPKASPLSDAPSMEVIPNETREAEVAPAPAEALTPTPEKKVKAKRAPRKTVKKRTVLAIARSSPNIERKIKIVERISGKLKENDSAKETKKKPQTQSRGAILKSDVSVALLSPFRTQVNHALIASSIARYAGVALVIVGGLFTLYGMDVLSKSTFRTVSSLVATTCVPGTYCTTDGTVLDPTVTMPGADIGINTSRAVLSGTIQVTVTVPRATRVDLLALRTETGTVHTVGALTKVSEGVWQRNWNTKEYDDASYRLKAVIVNEYGSYDSSGSVVYTTLNYPVNDTDTTTNNSTTTGTSASQETTATTSSGTSSSTAPVAEDVDEVDAQVSLSDSEPLDGTITVTTRVIDALSVKHFYRPKQSSQYTLLGSAAYGEKRKEWAYEFDTTRIPDGIYNVRTQIVLRDGRTHIDTLENIEIANTIKQATSTKEVQAPQSQTSTTTASTDALVPEISIQVPTANPQRNAFDVFVNVVDAHFVEMYVLPDGALTPRFLGLALRDGTYTWKYRVETRNIPNGSYKLYAFVRHAYGDTRSDMKSLEIKNTVTATTTETQASGVQVLADLSSEVKRIGIEDTSVSKTAIEPEQSVTEASDEEGDEAETDEQTEAPEEYGKVLTEHKGTLAPLMETYAQALRKGDMEAQRNLVTEFERSRDTLVSDLEAQGVTEAEISRIKEEIQNLTTRERERVERSENLIRERIGEARFDDADNDGISNFDEVHLYATNPYGADTDNDGFTDGAEVGSGYNPTDPSREALITYESPKDTGVVRDDILQVESITRVTEDAGRETPRAHVSGRALPQSFVTLYVFSTPVIVTVRTDDNGAWSYIFDKELEDGNHEIYIGMTDNAGRIVAKSAPFAFVKTAEAFSPISGTESADPSPVAESPTLLDGRVAFVTVSLAVIGLGLVLILLGIHVRPKTPVLVPVS